MGSIKQLITGLATSQARFWPHVLNKSPPNMNCCCVGLGIHGPNVLCLSKCTFLEFIYQYVPVVSRFFDGKITMFWWSNHNFADQILFLLLVKEQIWWIPWFWLNGFPSYRDNIPFFGWAAYSRSWMLRILTGWSKICGVPSYNNQVNDNTWWAMELVN